MIQHRRAPVTDQPAEPPELSDAINALRELIVAGAHFRHAVSNYFDIGISETYVLGYLSAHGSLSPCELADRVNLTASAITTVLDRLAAAGMTTRTPHPRDRRRTTVTLTHRGEQTLQTARSWIGAALRQLDPADLADAHRTFSSTAAALNQQRAAIKQAG